MNRHRSNESRRPDDKSGSRRALGGQEAPLDARLGRELDEAAYTAAEMCGAPMCLITLVNREGRRLRATAGDGARSLTEELSFCAYALQRSELFVLNDAGTDRRFAGDDAVIRGAKIRFYAGLGLKTGDGSWVGTLSVMDTAPRSVTPEQSKALQLTAKLVMARVEAWMQLNALSAELAIQREQIAKFEESDAWFRSFLDGGPMLRYLKDDEGKLLYYNHQVAERFGVDRRALLGRKDHEIWPKDLAAQYRVNDLEVLRGGKMVEVTEQSRDASGAVTYWKSYKFPFRGKGGQMLLGGVSMDVTQEVMRREALELDNQQLQALATLDMLTGLSNRRVFEERLEIEYSVARRKKRELSVLLLDIDNFKRRNDNWGHEAGDAVLRQLGKLLRVTMRAPDLVARFGGEEFIVLMPESDGVSAAAAAERIRNAVATEDWEHEPVTVSIGTATLNAKMQVATGLVLSADKALYAAKRAGRNRVLMSTDKSGQWVVPAIAEPGTVAPLRANGGDRRMRRPTS